MQIVFEYEDSVSDGTVYYYGLNRTHSSDGDIFVYNAHSDTVQLVNGGSLSASYTYDAFGNLLTSAGTSDNPFLYCSEYFDAETETYYLRARYYNPANGRFTAEDTHWNVKNRIYGDNPIKMNEHEDALGLNQYTLLIDYAAVWQSGNLYVYCGNNPVMYVDPSGAFFITTTALLIAGGIALFGTIGGLIGNKIANEKGATGWEKVNYIVGGAVIGGTVGAVAGYVAAPAVISATGIAGISVTAAGISTVGTGVGYATFDLLKNALGPAGPGYQWHHIVEQCQQWRSGFDAYMIQNTNNIVRVTEEVHKQISRYYSSIQDFTGGQVFRDWLTNQSFEVQYEWGKKILEMFS